MFGSECKWNRGNEGVSRQIFSVIFSLQAGFNNGFDTLVKADSPMRGCLLFVAAFGPQFENTKIKTP